MSSTKSDRIELTTGRIVTIVGVIIFLFIHFLIGIIIIVIGGIIQYGENSSMGSDTFEKEASVSCPKCGASHFYHYSDKDAFGRILCKSCRHLFHPSKDSRYQRDSSLTDETKYQTKGPPRSIGPDDCKTSQMAVGLANTRIEFDSVRRAVRDMAGALGQDRLSEMIRIGRTYLSANRVGAALACFYEAEQIQFNDHRLVKIRAKFGRPGTSFKVIAEKVV